MVLMSLSDVRPGMVLGVSLRNWEGHTLLGAGMALTAGYVARLRALGIHALWIEAADTDDIRHQDELSETTRLAATSAIQQTLALTSHETDALRRASIDEIQRALTGRHLREVFEGHAVIQGLTDQANRVVEEMLDQPVLTGLNSIRLHDDTAFQHCLGTAVSATMLGRLLGYDRETLRKLAVGCLLHDIGQIFVDDAILKKPGPLTPEENRRLQDHTLLGYVFIRDNLRLGTLAAQIAYQHHEHQDGTGYPRGLKGLNRLTRALEIHLPSHVTPMSEIAAIADFHDACSSDRAHRPAFAPDQVWQLLREGAGARFNRELVDLFLSVLPPYPVGSQVVVTDGRWTGYRGVVARVDRKDLARPVVRLLWDPAGQRIDAADVDIARGEATIRGVIGWDPAGPGPRLAPGAVPG
jgi:HD-GYP domain-containing protein (c-di-GMP phosphodiesterase class II)